MQIRPAIKSLDSKNFLRLIIHQQANDQSVAI